MSRWQDWQIKNLILGIMFLGWGGARLLEAPSEMRWSVPVVGATLLQLTVAWLFSHRAAARAEGSLTDMGVAGVSLLAGAILVTMMPTHREDWTLTSLCLIGLGTAITIVALLKLGSSFAIFPARRALVTDGLYQIVRHPAYAGELMIMLGVTLSIATWVAWSLLLLTGLALACRLIREDQILSADVDHAAYRSLVRWRLIPRIW